MVRYITTLERLGKDVTWLILQQARGIPEAKVIDDFMVDRTIVQMFAKADLSERLCITAAVRQMSGHCVYFAPEDKWEGAIERFPMQLLGAVSYYMDGMFVHGVPVRSWVPENEVTFPVINCGSPDAHPAHVIADIICMLNLSHDDLRNVQVAWVGSPSGAPHSLVTATRYFPFRLSIAIPPIVDTQSLRSFVQEVGLGVTFCDSPQEAVKDAQYIYIGSRNQLDFQSIQKWAVQPNLLSFAAPECYILLGTNPMDCLPFEPSILNGRRSLLLKQAENRLRVYKRMLHWVYDM